MSFDNSPRSLVLITTVSILTMIFCQPNNLSAAEASRGTPHESSTILKSAPIIIDDTDPGFSASANWTLTGLDPGAYGGTFHCRSTEAVNDPATWTFTISRAGYYNMSVRIPSGINLSQSAPYILPNGAVVSVNQQNIGGTWYLLGTQHLSAGTHSIKLSCWAPTGSTVIADVVRIAPQ